MSSVGRVVGAVVRGWLQSVQDPQGGIGPRSTPYTWILALPPPNLAGGFTVLYLLAQAPLTHLLTHAPPHPPADTCPPSPTC